MDSKQERCASCFFLTEEGSKWVCDQAGKEIHKVKECPEGVKEENHDR